MKIKNLSILFLSLLILTSCDKKINGTVQDNFGNPIEGVDVKIANSDFKSVSGSDGYFAVMYVPGKIEISMGKSGYTSNMRSIEITQKDNYPLGTIEMIKRPDTAGVYVVGNKTYIQPTKVIFSVEESNNGSRNLFNYAKSFTYTLPANIKYRFVERIVKDSIEIFGYKSERFEPVETMQGIVSEQIIAIGVVRVNSIFLERKKRIVEDSFVSYKIPKKNNVYCLIPIQKGRDGGIRTDKYGYCLKVSNDSLFFSE